MHGFPHAVKDLEPTRGIRTTMGSPLFKNFFPRDDSILVERIRHAGAIIIGKTNVPEFGLGSQTYNPVFGTTLNAYDQSKTCGGSSGGAAVALALQDGPGGGRQRSWRLAAKSGCVQQRVRVPNFVRPGAVAVLRGFHTVDFSARADGADGAGPCDVSFGDCRIRRAHAAFDSRGSRPSLPARSSATSKARASDGSAISADKSRSIPACSNSAKASLKVFEALGCSVETATPDYPLEPVWQSWLALRGWQIAAEFRASYPDPAQRALMKPELQWEIENGLKSTAMDVALASRVRTAGIMRCARFFEKYDFMIAPAGQVFPFDATIHWPKEVGGVAMDTYHRWMQVMIPISMSGCPALSVPAGFNDRGLPMGIQIVGPNHAEMACMQLAHAYDQATNWVTKRPPPLLSS